MIITRSVLVRSRDVYSIELLLKFLDLLLLGFLVETFCHLETHLVLVEFTGVEWIYDLLASVLFVRGRDGAFIEF